MRDRGRQTERQTEFFLNMIRNRQIDNQKGKLNSGRTTDSGKSFTRGKCLNVSVFVNELEREREREREKGR